MHTSSRYHPMALIPIFKKIRLNQNQLERPETEDDLTRDDLKQYEADIEAMNLIIISIPNDIYNSVDSCQTAREMCLRVERLMQGTALNVVDRETRFNNEFDQFIDEPGESLVSVYNRFAQLMNDLKQNKINLPIVTINTKFLNCLQLEWLKYVTSVHLARDLTTVPYDDLFDYLQQYEKLVIASRAKKLEKTHDPLAIISHSSSSSQSPPAYYVRHPSSVCCSTPTNNRLRSSSNTRNKAVVQADRVNIQSRNVGNDGRIVRHSYNVQEEIVEGSNVQKESENVKRNLRTSSSGNVTNVHCYNCNEKGHYARNYPKPRVQDSKYYMEQMLLAKKEEAGVTLSNEQNDFLLADAAQMEEVEELINSDIIFDDQNMDVNNGSVEHGKNVHASYKLEQLARNSYKEAKKEQIIGNKNIKKLFDSIKETRSQSQKEIKELIENVNQNTYAYGDVRAKNQDILITIYELKAMLKNAEKEDVKVFARTNKKTNVASKKNVVQSKKNVTNVDVKNALKAKDVLCVSCDKNVLTPCHDKGFAKFKLNVNSNVRRAIFTTPRTVKSKSLDTTPVVTKTRFDVVSPLSGEYKVPSASSSTSLFSQAISLGKYMMTNIKTSMMWQKWYGTKPNMIWSPKSITANTCPTVVKSRMNVVIQIVLWIVDSGCSKHMTGDLKLLKNFVEKFMGLGHNLFSVGQFCNDDLEVAFRSKTCYV
ncbi:copia protein [Tanacetum coccineum]